MSILPALCKENPPVTSGSPIKGPLMLKVYYFDRNYAESHSGETRHFSDGLFYHYSDVIMGTVASPILQTPALRLFTQPFVQEKVKEIKAPRHLPLWGEFTGDRWIPHTKGQ